MDTPGFWAPVAIIVGALFVLTAVLLVRNLIRHRTPATSPEELADMASLPMTPLQKRAWWGLALGLAMTTAIVSVIAWYGPTVYFEDDDLRLVVIALIFGVLAGYLYVIVPMARTGGLDERDRRIMTIAPQVQAAAGLVTVAGWSVALTESFRGQDGIPTDYMYLLFWSLFVAHMLAHSAGILFGYWFARDHAQG